MRKMTAHLTAILKAAGVDATVQFVPGEEGGYIVRVTSIQALFTAEPVAAKFQADYGIETLVSY